MFKIKKLLESSSKIAIFGHESIDGDCIGSMLGLGLLLEKQGKDVKYFTPSEPSKIFNFLSGTKKIKTNFDYGKYDVLVFVDFTGYNRISKFTENNEEYFNKNNLVIIDHHPGDHISKNALIIKDTNRISACEIVFENTYKRRKKYFDKDIATYFYMGISTDSGNFRNDEGGQTIKVFKSALKLLELGANKKKIIDNIFCGKTLESIKFMQLLLSRIKLDGNILYSYYDEKELKNHKIDEEQGIYAQVLMQDIIGPELVILFKKIDNSFKGSIRSKKIDVSKIAQAFGGGGHKRASGFKIINDNRPLQKQIKDSIDKIKKMI